MSSEIVGHLSVATEPEKVDFYISRPKLLLVTGIIYIRAFDISIVINVDDAEFLKEIEYPTQLHLRRSPCDFQCTKFCGYGKSCPWK